MRLDRYLTIHCFDKLKRLGGGYNSDLVIPILMYHSISDRQEDNVHPYFRTVTSADQFERQMRFLNESGYQVLALAEALSLLAQHDEGGSSVLTNKQSPNYVVITFDDGFRDFYSTAFPILRKYSFRATVFLASGLIEQNFVTGSECLKKTEIIELAGQGIDFGSHTFSHPRLISLSDEAIDDELSQSKAMIESIIGKTINLFSYPYQFPEEDKAFTQKFADLLVKNGYQICVTTIIGRARKSDNQLQLKRLPVNDCDDVELFKAKLEGAYDWLHSFQLIYKRLKYFLKQAPT